MLLQRALTLTHKLLHDLEKDVLSIATGEINDPRMSSTNRSTIGVMLSGCKVESCLIGAPAWNSEQMSTGDVIEEVDDQAVDDTTVQMALKGSDEPGSMVKLRIRRKKNAESVLVMLQRMASVVVADKRRLFELFTGIKDTALRRGDTTTSTAVTEAIQVWTRMMLQDHEHHSAVVRNVQSLQAAAVAQIQELNRTLQKLTGMPLNDLMIPSLALRYRCVLCKMYFFYVECGETERKRERERKRGGGRERDLPVSPYQVERDREGGEKQREREKKDARAHTHTHTHTAEVQRQKQATAVTAATTCSRRFSS